MHARKVIKAFLLATVFLLPVLTYLVVSHGYRENQRRAAAQGRRDRQAWDRELAKSAITWHGIAAGKPLPRLPIKPPLSEQKAIGGGRPSLLLLTRNIPYEPNPRIFFGPWLELLRDQPALVVLVVASDPPETVEQIRRTLGEPRLHFALITTSNAERLQVAGKVLVCAIDGTGIVRGYELFTAKPELAALRLLASRAG